VVAPRVADRDGCFEGMGLAALLPLGVLLPLVLTSSCSVLINRRFLGLIEEDAASLSRKALGEADLVIDGFISGVVPQTGYPRFRPRERRCDQIIVFAFRELISTDSVLILILEGSYRVDLNGRLGPVRWLL
jgi:hypothetical protein